MRRTINFTGRQRIERGDIALTVSGPEAGPKQFHLTLDLGEYELPPEARVVVEASRQTTWRRFDFGTVADPRPREECTLTEFGSAQGVIFRVKVVAPEGKEAAARILAQADSVTPGDPDQEGGGESLLPIDWNEGPMGEELYRIEFGETGVLLRVNKQALAAKTWHTLTDGPAFRALALPAILRQVLTYIVLVERSDEGWRGQWLRLAATTFGAGQPPLVGEGEEPDAAVAAEWIDRAVEGYCARAGTRRRAQEAQLTGGGES